MKCDGDAAAADHDLRSKFALRLALLLDAPSPWTVVTNVFSKQSPSADCLGMRLSNRRCVLRNV